MNEILRLSLLGWTQFERKPFVFLSVSMYLIDCLFVIKDVMANDFQNTIQPTNLNTDGFTKFFFLRQIFFCLDEVFFILGFPKFNPKPLA